MTIDRDKKGKFTKGKSANPTGRPAGSTSAARVRKAIEKDSSDIIKAVIASAKKGDMQAARILIDRICPALKAQSSPVSVPLGSTLVENGKKVIESTLNGQLPPDVGVALIRALSEHGKLIEFQELSDRLERIEQQLETRK